MLSYAYYIYPIYLIYSTPAEVVNLLSTEIRLTTAYLQSHPKVYWIWNHRKWCLENVPLGPESKQEPDRAESSSQAIQPKHISEGWRNDFWKTELRMLEAMLDADARNCELIFPLYSVSEDQLISQFMLGVIAVT